MKKRKTRKSASIVNNIFRIILLAIIVSFPVQIAIGNAICVTNSKINHLNTSHTNDMFSRQH